MPSSLEIQPCIDTLSPDHVEHMPHAIGSMDLLADTTNAFDCGRSDEQAAARASLAGCLRWRVAPSEAHLKLLEGFVLHLPLYWPMQNLITA